MRGDGLCPAIVYAVSRPEMYFLSLECITRNLLSARAVSDPFLATGGGTTGRHFGDPRQHSLDAARHFKRVSERSRSRSRPA